MPLRKHFFGSKGLESHESIITLGRDSEHSVLSFKLPKDANEIYTIFKGKNKKVLQNFHNEINQRIRDLKDFKRRVEHLEEVYQGEVYGSIERRRMSLLEVERELIILELAKKILTSKLS
jgi:hypothetical protein